MPVLTGLALAVCAALLGGWEWGLVCVVVLVPVARRERSVTAVLYSVAAGLFWIIVFRWTGDRRMFFPYTMHYAGQLACLTRSRIAGGSVILGFTLIRILQAATAGVLAVELVVSAAVLEISFLLHGPKMRGPGWRARASTIGSALAFAGLAF